MLRILNNLSTMSKFGIAKYFKKTKVYRSQEFKLLNRLVLTLIQNFCDASI